MNPSKRGSLILLALLVVIFAGGLALRVPHLGNRPMHADEAVHAVKFRDLWLEGSYRYDPNEYHGPTIYYAALPTVKAQGRRSFGDLRESDLRLGPAVVGAALILLLLLTVDGLGWLAVVLAALFLTLSPAFVFYSRYFIQEVFLAAFTLGMVVSGWRYSRNPRAGWAVAAGLFAGLMIATKENSVVTFAAATVAVMALRRAGRHPGAGGSAEPGADGADALPSSAESRARKWHVLLGVVVAVLSGAMLLSNFFRNPSAALDFLRAFEPWLGRAHGTDLHQHPWHYYLGLLAWNRGAREPLWTEALLLGLGAIGLLAALMPAPFRLSAPERSFARFAALFTLLLVAVYCAVPYKTPWNMLSFLLGIALLAGIGGAALLRLLPVRALALVAVPLIVGLWHLGLQSYRAAFVYPTSGGNPYAYAQTVPDVLELGEKVEKIAEAGTGLGGLGVEVISTDGYYWPLPWYLRRIERVGYFTEIPKQPPLDVVISSSDLDAALTERLPDHIMIGFSGMRQGVAYLTWVRMPLWEKYLLANPAPRDSE